MREHKYRAWDEERKIMRDVSKLVFDGILYIYYFDGFRHIPIKSKLREWTGLKDKNDKDIYEGDIIEINGVHYLEVIFFEGAFKLIERKSIIRTKFGDCYLYKLKDEPSHWEVIGNIYENKELLGDEK